ncbi:MAG: hypothetical protein H7328_04490 [Bdellovibrio sp.]|nr:hypothetical protein [Bdellovibrio sp.]
MRFSIGTDAENSQVFADTAVEAFTLTLPRGPAVGNVVKVINLSGTFGTNNLIVGRNTNKIMGLLQDMTVSVSNISFELVWPATSAKYNSPKIATLEVILGSDLTDTPLSKRKINLNPKKDSCSVSK